jgi:hypothetical protein
MYPESLGRLCSCGVFFGFNLTFLPQFVMGARGMPRRYWDYDPQYQIFHQLSTIGAYILGLSLFTTVVYLFWSFKNGKKAPRNPWGASTLEWQAPTPPTLYNFEKPPILHELYNYDDLDEVEPDVWERRAPIEEEPAKADAIVRAKGEEPVHAAPASAVAVEDKPVPPTDMSMPALPSPVPVTKPPADEPKAVEAPKPAEAEKKDEKDEKDDKKDEGKS